MTTWTQVRERVKTILVASGCTVLQGNERDIEALLPCYEVRLLGSSRRRAGGQDYYVTRQVLVVRYVMHVKDPMNKAWIDATWDAADNDFEDVPKLFADNIHLETDEALGIAHAVELMTDDGVTLEPYTSGKSFSGVAYSLPVTLIM